MQRLISTRSDLLQLRLSGFLSILVCATALGACSSTAPSTSQSTPTVATPSEPAVEESAEDFKNTIKWSTASELDNFGYDVYRSETEDGPFERINTVVIEGAGTTDEVSRYEYVDDTIDPHTTYYYYVESISMAGVRERFTPIAKVPPKIPPDGSNGV